MTPDEFYNLISPDRLLSAIVEKPTPCYLFFEPIIARQAEQLREKLGTRFQVHYAVKANPSPAILAAMRRLGLGTDVASGNELRAALEAGFDPALIEFSGPGKTKAELAQAMKAEIGAINVESLGELDAVVELARQSGIRPRVGLRVNPSMQTKSGLKMAGSTQFGLSELDLELALNSLSQQTLGVDFVGLHLHIGSQILETESVLENFRVAMELAQRVALRLKRPLRKLNFGGGFGVAYFEGQRSLDLSAVGREVAALIAAYAPAIEGTQLIIEPGRYLVAESGIYAARILYRKNTNGKEFAIVDGGMHHNYLLAGGMGQVIRRNFHFDILPGSGVRDEVAPYKLSVAGCLCTPQDLLLQDALFRQTARPGDYVLFFNCGAYGSSASPLKFLSHPEPAELLIQ